jgi:hypothetical protein
MPVLSLTVYNDGSALLKERRTFDLNAGVNTVQFTDVPETIDATSLGFVSLTNPAGTVVLEQSYHYDLVDSDVLLRRYLEQTIEVMLEDSTKLSGELLAQNPGVDLILRLPDGQIDVIQTSRIAHIRLPSLPSGLMSRPMLRWLIQSAISGPQEIDVTYLAGGINWSADYNVRLARSNDSLNLNGWITLTNFSGATFDNVLVKLVAGEIARSVPPRPMLMKRAMASEAAFGGVEQREIFEYNLYEIQRPVTLVNKETKQIEFVAGQTIPALVYYTYEAPDKRADSWLEFSTGKKQGLGADLPAGRMRVYQEDTDGAALLIGESQIDHTPQGETLTIRLGSAFDLVGERKQIESSHPAPDLVQERYEIRLRNRKEQQAVKIRVKENLARWPDWEILTASHPYTRIDVRTIEFRVLVPPNGESVIDYTVLYRHVKS